MTAALARVRGPGVGTLTLWGGAAFWLVNLAISLTPVAARYRADERIAYVPMLAAAAVGGLAIAAVVAVVLRRVHGRLWGAGPVLASLLLGGVALVVATLLVEVPAKLVLPSPDPWRSLLTATIFNVLRILGLALAVGVRFRAGAPAS
jgi:hypothetical protein